MDVLVFGTEIQTFSLTHLQKNHVSRYFHGFKQSILLKVGNYLKINTDKGANRCFTGF